MDYRFFGIEIQWCVIVLRLWYYHTQWYLMKIWMVCNTIIITNMIVLLYSVFFYCYHLYFLLYAYEGDYLPCVCILMQLVCEFKSKLYQIPQIVEVIVKHIVFA